MKRKIMMVVLCVSLLIMVSACSNNESTKVVFGESGWDSMKFHNAVAMFIAETAYDMETKEVSGTTPVTYGALKKGDIQVFMETWSETVTTYKEDISAGLVTELGVNYDDNVQGLYVPRYVIEGDAERGIKATAPDLKTVEDLQKYYDVFTDPDDPAKGRIYGSISGWAVDEIMRKKVAFYGLDKYYNYLDPGSDAALAAAIAGAYEKGDPIVAYYWDPTWLLGKYDLVLLGDAPYNPDTYREGQCAFPSMRVTVCVNPDFYNEHPEFCEFLSKYRTSSQLTSEALAYIYENNAEYLDCAKWFLTEHDDLIDQWLPADKAKLVRDALAQ
jgi:glycine betaine/proline transport system substrate-binding protein